MSGHRVSPGLVAAAAGGTAALAHVGPAIAWVSTIRRCLIPRLHGIGRNTHVALTFDDGPDPASTPAFLSALDRLGWKATFFMLGSMAERHASLAAEVAAAGHEVGLHGYAHRNQLARTPRAVVGDLARGLDVVAGATGAFPRWHRPPYGVISGAGLLAARRLELELVLWSAWGRDWRAGATPASVVADIRADMCGGGTVLLHDTDYASDAGAWRSALGALPMLAEYFADAGWEVGPLRDHAIGGGLDHTIGGGLGPGG